MSKSSFSMNRVAAVAWRVLEQISRDRRTLGMMIAMPAIIMLIFGFALGGEIKNVPILVDNQDIGYTAVTGPNSSVTLHLGDNITLVLGTDDRVKVTLGSFNSGRAGVDRGDYSAAILLPANLSQSLSLKNSGQNINTTIFIFIDGTKPTIESGIISALQTALQECAGSSGITVEEQFAFGGVEYSGLDVGIPSVIAFVLTFLVLLISLIIVARETISGILPRLYTTPLSAIERLLGYSAALLIFGFMMVGIVMLIGVGVFGAAVQGSYILLFFGAVLYALAHIFLAIFLSNFARNELQAVQMAPLIALPSMALSGMLIPVNSFPDWVQVIAKFVPMYYGNRIFEGIMLKGYGFIDLSWEFAVVTGIAALFFGLAVMTVKDRIPE